MAFAAGRFRHRLAFKEQVIVTNSNGDQEKDWVLVPSGAADQKFAAGIEQPSARELLAAGKSNSEISCKIVMRYNARINASMRAEHDDGTTVTIYNLTAPTRDAESGLEGMTILATALLNDG